MSFRLYWIPLQCKVEALAKRDSRTGPRSLLKLLRTAGAQNTRGDRRICGRPQSRLHRSRRAASHPRGALWEAYSSTEPQLTVIVVLDTNVWISALQFAKHRGTPTRALEKAMTKDVIATCTEIEIHRVLTEKFSWEATSARAALEAVLARATRVEFRGIVKECRDPKVDMFLECAYCSPVGLDHFGEVEEDVVPISFSVVANSVFAFSNSPLFL